MACFNNAVGEKGDPLTDSISQNVGSGYSNPKTDAPRSYRNIVQGEPYKLPSERAEQPGPYWRGRQPPRVQAGSRVGKGRDLRGDVSRGYQNWLLKPGLGDSYGKESQWDENSFPRRLIAIGGMNSWMDDDFNAFSRDVGGPNTTYYPTQRTGYGMLQTGVDQQRSNIINAIDANLAQKIPVTLAGHSLGGLFADELRDRYAGNPNVDIHAINPPYDGWWGELPGLKAVTNIVPGLGEVPPFIQEGTERGIANHPNTFSSDEGKTANWGQPDHSPWTNPDYPGNQEAVDEIIQILRGSLQKPWEK